MSRLVRLALVAALSLALLAAGCGGSGKKGNGSYFVPAPHQVAAVR